MQYEWVLLAIGGWIIVEVIKMVANRHISVLTHLEREQLNDLYRWHSKTDEDGRPIWYMPPKLIARQEKVLMKINELVQAQVFHGQAQQEILKTMRDLAYAQRETARILAELEKKLK